MSVKQDFLAEIPVGSRVTVYFGQGIFSGEVLRLTDSTVCLKTADGMPRISLDAILAWDPVGVAPAAPKPAVKPAPAPVATLADRFDSLLSSAMPLDVDEVANYSVIVEDILRDHSGVKNVLASASSTFLNLLSQIRAGQKVNIPDRFHDIRAKLLNLILNNPVCADPLRDLLGSMTLLLGDYKAAGQYYAQAGDWIGVLYVSHYSDSTDDRLEAFDHYFGQLEEEDPVDPFLLKLYADAAAAAKDVGSVRHRFDFLRSLANRTHEDREELGLLCACAVRISRLAGLSLDWLTERSADMGVEDYYVALLDAFFGGLPEDWNQASSVPEPEEADDQPDEPEESPAMCEDDIRRISHITSFRADGRYGFICERPERPGDCFFHLGQVIDDTLRKMLALGQAIGLEVSYIHAINLNRRMTADDIRLTEAGLAEANRRLEGFSGGREAAGRSYTGYLDEYNSLAGSGMIHGDGHVWTVRRDAIIDPNLRAQLALGRRIEQQVEFTSLVLPGRRWAAVSVRLPEGSVLPSIADYELESLIAAGEVTREELETWPERRQRMEAIRREEAEQAADYSDIPYRKLEPWRIPVTEYEAQKAAAEARASGAAEETADSARMVVQMDRPRLPAKEPIPQNPNNRFFKLEPYSSDGMLYERAHELLLAGDLAAAEEAYLLALRAGERMESTLGDLVGLYLRMEDRLTDALDLLDAFGGRIGAEKRRNLQLSVYQKCRDRACKINLCYLLEETMAGNIKDNTRLHYQSLQATTLLGIGEFAMAADACARWHSLREAISARSGGRTASQSGMTNTVKTVEAAAKYLLGETEAAREMASSLTDRSEDPVIRAILDGTLTAEQVRSVH